MLQGAELLSSLSRLQGGGGGTAGGEGGGELPVLNLGEQGTNNVLRELKESPAHKFDLLLCDAGGNVCVAIRGFTVRLLDRPAASPGRAEAPAPARNAPLTFSEEWLPQPLAADGGTGTGAVICLLADEANREMLQAVAAAAAPRRQAVFVAPAAAGPRV